VWEDSDWNWYSEVHNGGNISTWTTGLAEILVEQLGSAATDAHPATRMGAVWYWKEVLGSAFRSCSAVIDCQKRSISVARYLGDQERSASPAGAFAAIELEER
jgi:hypothetical protein